jgi:3-oxoacyl-[acyl-carrier protein] reductase
MDSGVNVLSGKVAIVTGGSSGIGAAIVRILAENGADVVVGFNSGKQRAEDVIGRLPRGRHSALQINIESGESVVAAADVVKQQYGRADILVNSAGFTSPVPHADLEKLDDDLFDRLLIANVRGPFSVIRAFVPMLRASGDAVIVNISSISAFTGSGSNIAYCAAKAALDTMTMSLARVLGPEIRVNCVSPAAVPTGFVTGRDRAAVEKIARNTPLQKVVEPADVANAVLACVTHLKTMTGSRIVVDGGRFLV